MMILFAKKYVYQTEVSGIKEQWCHDMLLICKQEKAFSFSAEGFKELS